MGIVSLSARRASRVGLVALLGLSLALVTVSAGHATSGHAVTAKKKCKKKHHSAAVAKKKCKKKKKQQVQTVVLPPPGPLVRGTVSWPEGDLDLNVFDASGNHAGYESPPNAVINHIPDTSHSGDVTSGGSESFTDNIFVVGGPSNRQFSYSVCFFHDDTATFTGVTSTGVSQTISRTGSNGTQWNISEVGGPLVPASFNCPG